MARCAACTRSTRCCRGRSSRRSTWQRSGSSRLARASAGVIALWVPAPVVRRSSHRGRPGTVRSRRWPATWTTWSVLCWTTAARRQWARSMATWTTLACFPVRSDAARSAQRAARVPPPPRDLSPLSPTRSVPAQVLSVALEAFQLTIHPITSPEMKGVAEEPTREDAFICNLEVRSALMGWVRRGAQGRRRSAFTTATCSAPASRCVPRPRRRQQTQRQRCSRRQRRARAGRRA